MRTPRGTGAVCAVAVSVALGCAASVMPTRPAPPAPVVTAERAPVRPVVSLDLPYADDGDPAHRLDLFVPGGHASARPLVLFVHGGSWTHGSKSSIGGGTGERTDILRETLLAAGYAVASVEYRFSTAARFPAQVHDVKAATRFLRSRAGVYHLDPTRFAVAGESAGGHLAELLGFTGGRHDPWLEGEVGVTGVTSAVSAVVAYYGVSDLSRVASDREAAGCGRGQDGATSPEGRLVGGDPEAPSMRDVVARANPVTYVGITSPPTMLLHGTRDCLVPPAQSTRLRRALAGVGVRTQYVAVDAPHGGPLFNTTPGLPDRVRAFLDSALGVR